MNYKEAEKKLGNRDSRKLGNNTYLQRRANDAIAVKLHSTDVVTFLPDGSTILDSGGWKTPTTKQRMNEYGPVRIGQERSDWIVYGPGWTRAGLYRDGMRIGPRGGLYGLSSEVESKKRKKLRNKIATYSHECAAALPLEMPGGGDCWDCSMFPHPGTGHLEMHMREKYIVPTLVWKALEYVGYDSSRQIIHGVAFKHDGYVESDNLLSIARDAVRRAVAKYLRHQFGL